MTKKVQLHSVPAIPVAAPTSIPETPKVEYREFRDVFPKPTYDGVKKTRATALALRQVILDHTYTEARKPRDRGPSKLSMFLWTLLIGGLIAASAIYHRPKEVNTQPKLYPLQLGGK